MNIEDERAWVGVDLDGTLAYYERWEGHDRIGEPIAPMVELVRKMLADGVRVKVFTARVAAASLELGGVSRDDALRPIYAWCIRHIGQVLEVTSEKDAFMERLYDDSAVPVIRNFGCPECTFLSSVRHAVPGRGGEGR